MLAAIRLLPAAGCGNGNAWTSFALIGTDLVVDVDAVTEVLLESCFATVVVLVGALVTTDDDKTAVFETGTVIVEAVATVLMLDETTAVCPDEDMHVI